MCHGSYFVEDPLNSRHNHLFWACEPSEKNLALNRGASTLRQASLVGRGSLLHLLSLAALSLMIGLGEMPVAQASDGTCPTLYRDRDGDGYGSPDFNESRVSCTSQAGFVTNSRDCNDLNPRIYPGASNDFWTQTLGTSDCSVQQSFTGSLITVNCPVCSPDDQECRARVGQCNHAQGCAFSSIQDGISEARNGDTVEICQGVYNENIDFLGKSIEVRGRLTHMVVLTGDGSSEPAVTFSSGELSDTRLSHLIISPSVRGGWGGGIYVENSSPSLSDLTLQGNTLSEEGGAMVIMAVNGGVASPLVQESRFIYNHPLDGEYGAGGAVGIRATGTGSLAEPTFQDVVFADNTALIGGAVHVLANQSGVTHPSFIRTRFLRNSAVEVGSALAYEVMGSTGSLTMTSTIVEKHSEASESVYLMAQAGKLPATFQNVTFAGNVVDRGLIYGMAGPYRGQLDVRVSNAIFAFNQAVDSVINLTAYGRDSYAKGDFSYTDVWSNGYLGTPWANSQSTQNIYSFDPHFRGYVDDADTPDDLSLAAGSPAINAGNPSPSFNDSSNNRNDLGAFGGPDGHWPSPPPTLLSLSSPLPNPEDMVLARQVSFEMLNPADLMVSCLEEGRSVGVAESLMFSASSLRKGLRDILGLKAETSYDCFTMASNAVGMSGNAFEIVTPPLPFEIQGLWNLTTSSLDARQGYTLFNVFPNGFNPMYAVLVDMQGNARWYLDMYHSSVVGFDPDAFTADTVAQYRADQGLVLVGGGDTLGALPQTHPLEPSKESFHYPLGCASQQDEIQDICKTVPGSTLAAEVPNHETIMSVDGTKVMYLCTEALPQPGTTPEQYCVDSTQRQIGFSVEEWDVSNPNAPTNTWRWSSREGIEDCVLPLLAGQDDPYHANALWREESTTGGSPSIFVSLRHRNEVLKIDRATGNLIYKLGPLQPEDACPAITQPDPSQCPVYNPSDASCPGQKFEPFKLNPDLTDTTCPSAANYDGPDQYHPQWFYGQHAPVLNRKSDGTAQWYIHDNGRNSPDNEESPYSRGYSRALRMTVDESAHTATVDWQYCRNSEKGGDNVWYAPAWGSFTPVQKTDGTITDHSLLATSHCNICMKYEDSDSEDTFIAELNEQKQVMWMLNFGQNYAVYRAQRIDGCTRLPGRPDYLMGTPDLCVQSSSAPSLHDRPSPRGMTRGHGAGTRSVGVARAVRVKRLGRH